MPEFGEVQAERVAAGIPVQDAVIDKPVRDPTESRFVMSADGSRETMVPTGLTVVINSPGEPLRQADPH